MFPGFYKRFYNCTAVEEIFDFYENHYNDKGIKSTILDILVSYLKIYNSNSIEDTLEIVKVSDYKIYYTYGKINMDVCDNDKNIYSMHPVFNITISQHIFAELEEAYILTFRYQDRYFNFVNDWKNNWRNKIKEKEKQSGK